MSDRGRPPSSKRSLVRRFVLATVIGVLVFAAMSFYADVQSLRANLRAFAPLAFVVALVLATGNYVLRFVRWHYYLRCLQVRPHVGDSALVFTSGFVMSITPGKIGEVFKSLLLYESHRVPIERTAPIVLAERLTDLVALVLLSAVGSLAFERGVPVAIGGGIAVVVLLVLASWRALAELSLRVLDRLPLVGRITPRLREAYDALHTMTRPGPLLLATGLAVLSWSLECASLYVIVNAFPGVELGWVASLFAYSAPTVVGALALMPGGLGVTEAGMTGVLQALGGGAIGPAVATATTMMVRIATLWWAVVLGAGAWLLFRRRMRLRPAAPAWSAAEQSAE